MLRTTLALLLLGIASVLPLDAEVARLSGRLVSATDRPFRLAHVHLLPTSPTFAEPLYDRLIDSVAVAPDGTWSLSVKNPGYYDLLFTAVDHRWERVPLPVDGSEPEIAIDVRLSIDHFRESNPIRAVGTFSPPQPVDVVDDPYLVVAQEEGVAFRRPEPDRWVTEVVADGEEIEVQVIGIASAQPRTWEKRYVNLPAIGAEGSETWRFRYDGGGDYITILPVTANPMTLSIDFGAIWRLRDEADGESGSVRMKPEVFEEIRTLTDRFRAEDDSLEVRIRDLYETIEDRGEAVTEAAELVRAADEKRRRDADGLVSDNRHPLLRGFAALHLAYIEQDHSSARWEWHQTDSLRQRRIAQILPVDSPWWEVDPFLALSFFEKVDALPAETPRKFEYLQEQASGYGLRGVALAHLAAHADGGHAGIVVPAAYSRRARTMMLHGVYTIDSLDADPERFASLYRMLADEYRSDFRFTRFIDAIDPGRAIMPGNEILDFSFDRYSEGDADKPFITPASLRGRWYLLDFWATWCGPCVGDQPHLQAAFDRFGGDDFTIVSISFDGSWLDVELFRDERYPMPWVHGHVRSAEQGSIWEQFEIDGIPRMILVDPEGKIVRVDQGLRGERLVETLAEEMGEG